MRGLRVHRDVIEVPAERRACRSHRVATAGTAELMGEDGYGRLWRRHTSPHHAQSPAAAPNRQNNGHVSRSSDIIFSNGCVLESFSFAVKFQWFCSVVFACVLQTLVLGVLYFSLPQRLPYLDTHRWEQARSSHTNHEYVLSGTDNTSKARKGSLTAAANLPLRLLQAKTKTNKQKTNKRKNNNFILKSSCLWNKIYFFLYCQN